MRTRTAAARAAAFVLSLGLAVNVGSLAAAELKSAGPLAFGPDGVLFVADTAGAAVVAIETDDRGPAGEGALDMQAIDQKVADLLGTTPREILINDLAVNPESGRAYLSVSRGRGPEAEPVLIRVDPGGVLKVVDLDGVRASRVALPNPPADDATPERPGQPTARQQSITDLAYVDGRVFVAGLSNEEFSSRLASIPYPFDGGQTQSTSVEIFHGAHGRFETRSPVRTFLGYKIGDQPYLLAAYTCTPLVKFPVAELKPDSHVKGTTIAELGNRNRPLDIIAYESNGKPYLLLTNSSRGVMKIPADGVTDAKGIVEPVSEERQGVPYVTIASLQGVEELDKLDAAHAVILRRTQDGALNLETIDLP